MEHHFFGLEVWGSIQMEGKWEFGTYQASRHITTSLSPFLGVYAKVSTLTNHDLWFQLSILQQTSNTQIKLDLPLCESPLCLSNPRQGNF